MCKYKSIHSLYRNITECPNYGIPYCAFHRAYKCISCGKQAEADCLNIKDSNPCASPSCASCLKKYEGCGKCYLTNKYKEVRKKLRIEEPTLQLVISKLLKSNNKKDFHGELTMSNTTYYIEASAYTPTYITIAGKLSKARDNIIESYKNIT